MTSDQDLYIIAGDSWGCGEWQGMDISHRGLWQYMTDAGYLTINISRPGGSNLDTLERLQLFFSDSVKKPLRLPIKKVLIFQTEWHRDSEHYLVDDWQIDYHIKMICQWQYRLSELAVGHNVEFGLIGGCSDTIYIDSFAKEYPNLSVVCQSLVNLCLNGDHRIDKPCFGMTSEILENFPHYNLSTIELEQLIDLMQQSLERYELCNNHPSFFQCSHANRISHKLLFDHIRHQEFI